MADGKRDVGSILDRDFEAYPPRGPYEHYVKFMRTLFADPVIKFRREPYPYYHRKYNRVPTIDQCYEYDTLCQWEADQQIHRDRALDLQITILLRERFTDCMLYERYEREKCRELLAPLDEAETNFFIKYGETGMGDIARPVFMKQKHRMAWERRHGEVGTGMRDKHYKSDGTVYWK